MRSKKIGGIQEDKLGGKFGEKIDWKRWGEKIGGQDG